MSPSTVNSSRPFRPARTILAALIVGIVVGAIGQTYMAPASTTGSATCTTRS